MKIKRVDVPTESSYYDELIEKIVIHPVSKKIEVTTCRVFYSANGAVINTELETDKISGKIDADDFYDRVVEFVNRKRSK